jgi:hypothetical protein
MQIAEKNTIVFTLKECLVFLLTASNLDYFFPKLTNLKENPKNGDKTGTKRGH